MFIVCWVLGCFQNNGICWTALRLVLVFCLGDVFVWSGHYLRWLGGCVSQPWIWTSMYYFKLRARINCKLQWNVTGYPYRQQLCLDRAHASDALWSTRDLYHVKMSSWLVWSRCMSFGTSIRIYSSISVVNNPAYCTDCDGYMESDSVFQFTSGSRFYLAKNDCEKHTKKNHLGHSDWILAQYSKAVVRLERQHVLFWNWGLNQLQIATKGYRIFIQAAALSWQSAS